jgi:nitrate/nitrite-specific signal transduction histidine kinase
MAEGSGDDLVAKQKEFIDAFFKKASEFTEELLRENEKLRFRVVQLEEQIAASARAIPTPATLKELVERLHTVEQEREALIQRFTAVEAENREYQTRYLQIERENNNLASLYVAVHQLHSTFDLREVLQTIVEIVLNFVGAKIFAVYLLDDESQMLRAVVSEHVERDKVPSWPLGKGTVGGVAATGQPIYGALPRTPDPTRDEPAICVPLKIQSRVVGAVAIWEFLQQKTELADVDFEIFHLLGVHAASALEAARLAAQSPGEPRLGFGALAGLI